MSLRKKLLDTFGAQVSSDHERYPADVKCLGFLYLYVGRYPRNNASRNSIEAMEKLPGPRDDYETLLHGLKSTLDPNDVLSPGRYDFRYTWPDAP